MRMGLGAVYKFIKRARFDESHEAGVRRAVWSPAAFDLNGNGWTAWHRSVTARPSRYCLWSQNDFCDSSHLGAQPEMKIREPAIWYFIWRAPPHSGRPFFSTFRAPAARRILCAYGTQYYYGRGSGPWVCVLLGSELTSLISQLFWDQV